MVPSPIAAKWLLLGAETGSLGAVTGAATPFVSLSGAQGNAQSFANGVIFGITSGSHAGQAFYSAGLILARFTLRNLPDLPARWAHPRVIRQPTPPGRAKAEFRDRLWHRSAARRRERRGTLQPAHTRPERDAFHCRSRRPRANQPDWFRLSGATPSALSITAQPGLLITPCRCPCMVCFPGMP